MIVADVTVFRQSLVTAKPSCTRTCTSMDDDCNNSTEGVQARVQGLECRISNHIKRMSPLKKIYMKVCMIFAYCAYWAVDIIMSVSDRYAIVHTGEHLRC